MRTALAPVVPFSLNNSSHPASGPHDSAYQSAPDLRNMAQHKSSLAPPPTSSPPPAADPADTAESINHAQQRGDLDNLVQVLEALVTGINQDHTHPRIAQLRGQAAEVIRQASDGEETVLDISPPAYRSPNRSLR